VPSKDQWVRTDQDEVDPPILRATPGRPKKVRRRGPEEPRNPYCMRKGWCNNEMLEVQGGWPQRQDLP
jgi:hypothetical protein